LNGFDSVVSIAKRFVFCYATKAFGFSAVAARIVFPVAILAAAPATRAVAVKQDRPGQ
jgi:uncharacterized membrane protein YedE/YeeE